VGVNADWITSPTARRILMHWADPRPAWLWSQDGARLIWRNGAARLFNARLKKSGLKLSADAVPIKGQVARLVRLGAIGRSSLSRVQFLAGDKPVATTCSCTPLQLPGEQMALLLVGIDPIADDIRAAAGELGPDALGETLFPPGMRAEFHAQPPPLEDGTLRLRAGPDDAVLLLHAAEPTPDIAEIRREEGEDPEADRASDPIAPLPAAEPHEPLLPIGLAPLPPTPVPELPEAEAEAEPWVDAPHPPPSETGALTSLFDRLADDADLYAPLTAADEDFSPPAAAAETPPDLIAGLIAAAEATEAPAPDVPADAPPPAPPEESRTHWMITGRGFRALTPPDRPEPAETEPPGPEPAAPATEPPPGPVAAETAPDAPHAPSLLAGPPPEAADPDLAEKVTRYNFEELGRILTDRVGAEARPDDPPPAVTPNGVVSLNAETLVLNRLPLAVLLFRDQQVLFANRALTDLLDYESVESLRAAGIAAIFPSEESGTAGPVGRLVRRDGTSLPVNARLQSVSWQGRPALMLSASASEPVRGHELAVRAFVELSADARSEGFIATDRGGVVTRASAATQAALGRSEVELVGQPVAGLLAGEDAERLRKFLEQPARFAETARPHFTARLGEARLVLFAEGQAGIVTGYFGVVTSDQPAALPPLADTADGIDPALLSRLSRGLRRPLNTIIGFADLIRATARPDSATDRTIEYARDIRTAGLEIAVLADELDDFTRLQDGSYAARPTDVDLGALLESCLVRVRPQAGIARVLVRSAIPETLPRIEADRASLGQALLNLLASAIDQTPVGGSVILSAQREDDGSIAVNVRDGATSNIDLGERFVVFRDGTDKDGAQLAPVRSSVGLALTRSLLAVNACSLSVDPAPGTGTRFSLLIPSGLVAND
jgi:signal transduction histidine kinase